MFKRIFNKTLVLLFALCFAHSAFALDGGAYGSFSPYSVFGYGTVVMPGTTYNLGMGGVGIASRNNRFINTLNPAAVTARDSLAFMLDFSVSGRATVFHQGDKKSANNTFNIGGLVFSFPLWKNAAMMVGVSPYSYIGYDYRSVVTDTKIVATMGNVDYSYSGIGGLYQIYAAAGHTFFKRLSIGAQADFLIGSLVRTDAVEYGDEAIPDLTRINDASLTGIGGKFGIQYEQPIGDGSKIGIGATYKLSTNLNGWLETTMSSTQSSYNIDTLRNTPGRLRIASECGVGLSFTYADKLRLEFDYTRSDWTKTGLDKDSFFKLDDAVNAFTMNVSQSFRLGGEYVPNRSDIRYYMKKVAYRAGVYYNIDYFKVGGRSISSKGITLGATFPVFRWYNGVTVGLEFGQRGCADPSFVKENYFSFSFALNLFDIWFQKPKYE